MVSLLKRDNIFCVPNKKSHTAQYNKLNNQGIKQNNIFGTWQIDDSKKKKKKNVNKTEALH